MSITNRHLLRCCMVFDRGRRLEAMMLEATTAMLPPMVEVEQLLLGELDVSTA
jgi:hypothetical protein